MTNSVDTGSDSLDRTPMPKPEWDAHVKKVTEAMQNYTKKFVTPVSQVIEHDYGKLFGTGNYIELHGQHYLLTNEHVARGLERASLAHQFFDHDGVFRATNPFRVLPLPLDVAVSAIDQKIWTHEPHGSAAISEKKLSIAHTAVAGEILFFKGYSGEQSQFLFGSLFSKATSYSAQEVALPIDDDDFNSRFHFALDYRPDRATPIDGNTSLPIPKGFSGSLVWNTRFVETFGKGPNWTPECAEVTGLVWGWPSSAACLVATRIEYVRSFLLRMG
ncbi:MAG: hypothetical protein KF826_09485 [Xanthobacteraceae bacterium]|nr:hypothetical protein [Xanthobacteraceae bacterium]